ncbi:hypothetical protein LEP1GSC124_3769 [Leptospira interrogans serovar Pyrogenes str. 200701872]|uniref:Uncharacterized protein n=1 Tax=Leptospira interrogans serovar Pyrogenes str. 200701872 TaxID=1193029 RepID=M6ZPA4_LEPIR|nr:hypothetical protein LEP1GSC124_3769 [Leptospira interrogans serovar Pyrogenes str. 200701872]
MRFQFQADFALKSHSPLRVLNPSEPTHWTFTEKCSPLIPSSLEISYQDKSLSFDRKKLQFFMIGPEAISEEKPIGIGRRLVGSFPIELQLVLTLQL